MVTKMILPVIDTERGKFEYTGKAVLHLAERHEKVVYLL